jgi:hypothetical protein
VFFGTPEIPVTHAEAVDRLGHTGIRRALEPGRGLFAARARAQPGQIGNRERVHRIGIVAHRRTFIARVAWRNNCLACVIGDECDPQSILTDACAASERDTSK